MKVLYLHQYFSTSKGTTGTRSYEFAKALVASGHSVTILCGSTQNGVTGLAQPFLKGKRQGVVDGIKVIEFDLRYSNYDTLLKRTIKFFKYVFKTIKLVLLSEKYDLLYITSTPLTVVIPGILAKVLRRKPFILEIRDLWPELPKAMGVLKNPFVLGVMSFLERMAYHFADFGVGLSPGICEGMSRFGTLSKENIALIPNGCDIELFRKNSLTDNKGIPALLSRLLSNKQFVAIFCGAHGVANGLDAALDAAEVLNEKGAFNISLVFIGDGKMKPFLLDRSKRKNLHNCYFFDSIPKSLLSTVLRQADIGMMLLRNVPAFYYGTSPNKFFDYIASGLPVLNNYPGWMAELIENNNCGVVVPPESPKEFANALIEFANLSDEQRKLFVENSLKLAKNSFDRKELAKKFVKICEYTYEKKTL